MSQKTPIVQAQTPPTLPMSPPVPPKPAAYQPQALLINTDTETLSNHPSEQLVDLTPTTSAAPSSFADDPASLTPNETHDRQTSPANSYWSVNEWAMQHSGPAAFYSPPQSEAVGPAPNDLERAMSEMMEGSQAGSGEHASQAGTEDMDVLSDDDGPGISTPGSWTDVGSQVSEDLYS